MPYGFLADAVLVLHVAVVLFVIGGLLLVVVGNASGWRWVDAPWFRLAHLATILVVVGQAWLGLACPLTTLEAWSRAKSGAATHSGGFVEHGLHALLYWHAPTWMFTAAYSLFGLAVVASRWRHPPRPWRRAAGA